MSETTTGPVVPAEAVEVTARAMVPSTVDPDRPHGASEEPLWTYYAEDATAALTAALPVLLAPLRKLAEVQEESCRRQHRADHAGNWRMVLDFLDALPGGKQA